MQKDDLHLVVRPYRTGVGEECFLGMETAGGRLAAFLRLHLPADDPAIWSPEEVRGSAMIREVHVYGRALHIGAASGGEAQHLGLGSQLIEAARLVAREAGYSRLAVISAIGARNYYRRRGFVLDDLYMHTEL